MPRKIQLNADEVIAEEVFKLLGAQRFQQLAEQIHHRHVSVRSAAVACAVAARAVHPEEPARAVALALIRLVQFAGSRPTAEDVRHYEQPCPSADTVPAPAVEAQPAANE